uniref:NADH dehydrogenase subunit 6 n=1 Tax=Signoretia aureola TaxID=2901393 RepID=A0A8K2ATZ4_9HEMI|nr:NADH dehydrogenase subunit 6 [Signoretia aureola]
MKIMLMKLMIMNSTLTIFLKTPMTMGITLLLQTMLMIMLMNKQMSNSWFMMITFLMMIGGLLIIFTYMSSITSNEKFKLTIIPILMLIVLMILILEEMNFENQINENQLLINMKYTENISMSKMYNKKSMLMTVMMINFLILTMISVSKIVKHHEGPLRSKNYE